MNIEADNLDRLTKLVIDQRRCSPGEAGEFLSSLTLQIVCGEEIRTSTALQAALLTTVNAGARAFRGGVFVELPVNVGCILPAALEATLTEAVINLGATVDRTPCSPSFQISTLPLPISETPGIQMSASGWTGAILPLDHNEAIRGAAPDFALGGVLAAGLAVGRAFLTVSGLNHYDLEEPEGASLWRPDLSWDSPEAIGPELRFLPERLALLGLGHLGQAFAWTLGMLSRPTSTSMLLQLIDFDRVVKANHAAGLLCTPQSIGKLKTRVVSDWLEARGIETRLSERRLDNSFKVQPTEPKIAICGLDSAESRSNLDKGGWDHVIDVGIGGGIQNFDRFRLNTFPDSSRGSRSFLNQQSSLVDPDLAAHYRKYMPNEGCGMIAENLAGRSISSAFVGATASAFAIGELLRGLHGGSRISRLDFEIRSPRFSLRCQRDSESYLTRLAPNGFIELIELPS